jgi:hypothetical protein
MFRSTLATVTGLAALLLGASVHAGPILNQSEMSAGGSSQTVNGVTIDAFNDIANPNPGGTFARKTEGMGPTAATGMGIQQGTAGEIGFQSAQAMVFDFTARPGGGINLGHLQIAFLYPDGQFNDDGDEVAAVDITNASGTQTVSLTATDLMMANVASGFGSTVTNLLIAEEPQGGGLWQIDFSGNPAFDGVTQLTLRSGAPGTSSQAADFAFVEVAQVPAPATLALVGSGLIGLGVLTRRRARA